MLCRVLAEIKTAHASIELNQLLCEYKESPGKAAAVMKKLSTFLLTQPISWLLSTSSYTRKDPKILLPVSEHRAYPTRCITGTSLCWRRVRV